ncbi:MAG: hypothetical protein KAU26_04615, partial [Methylococcales bacterium]|nr:hypothetical protein [Methylococcales bacterium]
MIEKKGDSLTFKTNHSPLLNISGQSKSIGKNLLDNKIIQKIIFTLITADEKQDLIKNKSLESTHIMGNKYHFTLKITIKGNTLEMIVLPKISEPEAISKKPAKEKEEAEKEEAEKAEEVKEEEV